MKKCYLLILMMVSVGAAAAPTKKDPLSNFFKDKTKIEKPFELRDPFRPPQVKAERNMQKEGYYAESKGQYSNIAEVKINSIQEIKLVGVMIGKERRALVSSGKGVVILKEGTKIGDEGIEIKAILPGGIILVEKMINVYGQEEYLETVIPISK